MTETINLPAGIAGSLADIYRVAQVMPDGSIPDRKVTPNTIAPRAPTRRRLARRFAKFRINNQGYTASPGAYTTCMIYQLPAVPVMARLIAFTDGAASPLLGSCLALTSQIGNGHDPVDDTGVVNNNAWAFPTWNGFAANPAADYDYAGDNVPPVPSGGASQSVTVPANPYMPQVAGAQPYEVASDWMPLPIRITRTDGGAGTLILVRTAMSATTRTIVTWGAPDPATGYLPQSGATANQAALTPQSFGAVQPYYCAGNAAVAGSLTPGGGWGTGQGLLAHAGLDLVYESEVIPVLSVGDSTEASQDSVNQCTGLGFRLSQLLNQSGVPACQFNEALPGRTAVDFATNAIRQLKRYAARGGSGVLVIGGSWNGLNRFQTQSGGSVTAAQVIAYMYQTEIPVLMQAIELADRMGWHVVLKTLYPTLVNSAPVLAGQREYGAWARRLAASSLQATLVDCENICSGNNPAAGYLSGYSGDGGTHPSNVALAACASAAFADYNLKVFTGLA